MRVIIGITLLATILTSCTSRFGESVDHWKNVVSDDRYEGTFHPDGYFIDKQYDVICYKFTGLEKGGLGCARLQGEVDDN